MTRFLGRPRDWSWRAGDALQAGAALKSYVGPAVVVFLLYDILLWPIALIFNWMWLSEAERMERISGVAPAGKGCLRFMLWWAIVSVLLSVLLVLWLLGLLDTLESQRQRSAPPLQPVEGRGSRVSQGSEDEERRGREEEEQRREASRLLERAESLEASAPEDSLRAYEELLRRYPGTPATEEAKRRCEALKERLAGVLLECARSLEEKWYDDAVLKYEELLFKYPDTNAAKEASPRYAELQDILSKAKQLLNEARSWRDNGRTDTAKSRYEWLIQAYPKTRAAEQAKSERDKLNAK